MHIDKLLTYIKCPKCGGVDFSYDNNIHCNGCRETFEIRKGIPIMIKHEDLKESEKKQKKIYDKHYKSRKQTDISLWERSMIKKLFSDNHYQTYIDIGCSDNAYAVIAAAKKKILSFGINISFEAVLKAKKRADSEGLLDSTAFVVCSAENIALKDNLFEYASALSILEHIENDNKTIKEMARILKNNAKAYICVPNSYKDIPHLFRPIYKMIDKKVGHKRHYSRGELNQIMENSNFKPIKHFYNGHFVKILQLLLEKLHILNEKTWWQMENKDMTNEKNGLQLNAIYKLKKDA